MFKIKLEFDLGENFMTYTIAVSAGSLPPGMQLQQQANADGTVTVFIVGTPTQSGAFSFQLTATDPAGNSVTASFTVTVATGATPITLTPNGGNLPGETQGVASDDQVTVISGGSATPPTPAPPAPAATVAKRT
jgi:Putative Ig domain